MSNFHCSICLHFDSCPSTKGCQMPAAGMRIVPDKGEMPMSFSSWEVMFHFRVQCRINVEDQVELASESIYFVSRRYVDSFVFSTGSRKVFGRRAAWSVRIQDSFEIRWSNCDEQVRSCWGIRSPSTVLHSHSARLLRYSSISVYGSARRLLGDIICRPDGRYFSERVWSRSHSSSYM